jgi:hypothetical protein
MKIKYIFLLFFLSMPYFVNAEIPNVFADIDYLNIDNQSLNEIYLIRNMEQYQVDVNYIYKIEGLNNTQYKFMEFISHQDGENNLFCTKLINGLQCRETINPLELFKLEIKLKFLNMTFKEANNFDRILKIEVKTNVIRKELNNKIIQHLDNNIKLIIDYKVEEYKKENNTYEYREIVKMYNNTINKNVGDIIHQSGNLKEKTFFISTYILAFFVIISLIIYEIKLGKLK